MPENRKVIGYEVGWDKIEFLLKGNVRSTSEKVFVRMANQRKLDVEHLNENGTTKLRIPIYEPTVSRVKETIIYPDVIEAFRSSHTSSAILMWTVFGLSLVAAIGTGEVTVLVVGGILAIILKMAAGQPYNRHSAPAEWQDLQWPWNPPIGAESAVLAYDARVRSTYQLYFFPVRVPIGRGRAETPPIMQYNHAILGAIL